MNRASRPVSFAPVTELPGAGATRQQLSMLYTRYRLAGQHSAGRDVLEVACGAGLGLGLLARSGRLVVAGDYDEDLLRQARAHYGTRIRLLRLDAQALPFADRSFDVVVLLEAIYYVPGPERFAREARRVLRPGGTLLVCSANLESPGFTPSRHARRYFTVPELRELMQAAGFSVKLFGGHPVRRSTPRDHAILLGRRVASALHLIPSTLKGRSIFKRIVYGRLMPIPAEIYEGMMEPAPLVPLSPDRGAAEYRVIFALGRLP